MNFVIPLEVSIPSNFQGDFGIISLVAVPILLLLAIILAIAKKKRAAKKALIASGMCAIVGVGLCSYYWLH